MQIYNKIVIKHLAIVSTTDSVMIDVSVSLRCCDHYHYDHHKMRPQCASNQMRYSFVIVSFRYRCLSLSSSQR